MYLTTMFVNTPSHADHVLVPPTHLESILPQLPINFSMINPFF